MHLDSGHQMTHLDSGLSGHKMTSEQGTYDHLACMQLLIATI